MAFLKLLIADDEESIRNGLKAIVDWESLGLTVIKDSSNGSEALRDIKDYQPDVVLMDIKMPGITGIEVMKEVNDYYKSIRKLPPSFIVLSGYSQFEYAQSAVNLGAKAYILKPVDEDELIEKIRAITAEIQERAVNEKNKDSLKKIETKDFFVSILQKGFFNGEEDTNDYTCLIASPEYFPAKDKQMISSCFNSYFSIFNTVNFMFDGKEVLIIKNGKDDAVNNCILRFVKHYPERVFITLGGKYKGYSGVIKSYNEAKIFQSSLYYISGVPVINQSVFDNFKASSERSNLTDALISDYLEKIIFFIETYDKKNISYTSDLLCNYFSNPSLLEADSKKKMISFLIELHTRLKAKYPERDFSKDDGFDVVPAILEKQTFQETKDIFESTLDDLIENFNVNTADSVIVKVIAYVKTNYTQDLKLESLGDLFNCNSAYLGKKFKKFTGVQFNTFIDNLRIEDAKQKLLSSDLKIYQISKLLGYSNTDYFFMKFKKATGLTPKEFRRQNGKVSDEE